MKQYNKMNEFNKLNEVCSEELTAQALKNLHEMLDHKTYDSDIIQSFINRLNEVGLAEYTRNKAEIFVWLCNLTILWGKKLVWELDIIHNMAVDSLRDSSYNNPLSLDTMRFEAVVSRIPADTDAIDGDKWNGLIHLIWEDRCRKFFSRYIPMQPAFVEEVNYTLDWSD